MNEPCSQDPEPAPCKHDWEVETDAFDEPTKLWCMKCLDQREVIC